MKSLFGKTIFSRIFIINIISVIVCLIVLGSMQMILVTSYIAHRSEESLGKNAESIVSLIQNNISIDSLRNILSGFSRSSHSHIIVINSDGGVLINTADSGFVKDVPAFIPTEYSKTVLGGSRNSLIGTMGGLFNETMFTLQLPILNTDNHAVGAVFVSTPIPEQQSMAYGLFRIMMVSAIVVVVISFMLSYVLAKRFSMPLSSIRDGANNFAKGNLDARVSGEAVNSDITEIAELASSFNTMASELEKVEDTRRAFISDVSHELRTPMTTISGFVYGILDGTIPPEKQNEYLKIVYDETSRLSRLVNTFLDINRMQSDKMILKKAPFDINEMIRLTIIGLEQRLEEKNIRISLNFDSDSCYVFADSDSIRRVLTNLLDNAVKFTDENGVISVTTTPKQNEVSVSVRNSGCGIPKEQQKMIFERLYKVDKSRSINRDGTGIGLYLVKSIIRAHGKYITVNSVEGQYAEFTFTLDRGRVPSKKEDEYTEQEENM